MSDKVTVEKGQVYLDKENKVNNYLWNPDFNPVPKDLRRWGAGQFTSLWIAMAVIVPTWTLATTGLALGLSWTQVIIYMFLGNLIILIPTIIQSHGGARYGVAEPQLTRSRWGIYGAQIPSWIRAVISMGWWGIESFIIAEAATYMYFVMSKVKFTSSLVSKIGPGTAGIFSCSFLDDICNSYNCPDYNILCISSYKRSKTIENFGNSRCPHYGNQFYRYVLPFYFCRQIRLYSYNFI